MQERIRIAFSIPIVKFCLHLIFFGMIVGNIFFSYRSSYIQNRVNQDNKKLEAVLVGDNLITGSNDYYSSDQYKSNLYKEQGFKNPDEEVLNVNLPESNNGKNKNEYIPDNNDTDNSSNLKAWLGCIFFGKNVSNLNLNSKNNNIDSWCK